MFYIDTAKYLCSLKEGIPRGGGQNRIVVHFPADRQKSLLVGTTLERGKVIPGRGQRMRGEQQLVLSQQANSLGRGSLKPNQKGKAQNAPSLNSAMQT